jgi:hypothetical protein
MFALLVLGALGTLTLVRAKEVDSRWVVHFRCMEHLALGILGVSYYEVIRPIYPSAIRAFIGALILGIGVWHLQLGLVDAFLALVRTGAPRQTGRNVAGSAIENRGSDEQVTKA